MPSSVITVIRGTVASANAYSSFAPCRMIPPYSCSVPGRNPGTSTNVRIGMLNASQNRTNRDAFSDASMSSVPGDHLRLVRDDPDRAPVEAGEADDDVIAHSGKISRNSPSSTTRRITSCMS